MQNGYNAEVWPIAGGDELWSILGDSPRGEDVTHIVIAAFFIPTDYIARLAFTFPHIKFVINSHSNVGFLQSEPAAITKLRETIDLQTESRNVFAGGNSERFTTAIRIAYGECIFLPNLYFLHGNESAPKVTWSGTHLRIGCFGASRVQKNFSTAIVAAIEVAKQLRTTTEIWINTGRDDGNGSVVYRAALAWTHGLHDVKLLELPWQTWAQFRSLVATMDVLIQPSYSETFSQVAADACAAGVPTVGGSAIEWLPKNWQANTDDATDIAEHVRHVLLDPHAGETALRALKQRNHQMLPYWKEFLCNN
jgi:glycosyltransferase involved in cell wall biosynthesis